jgi:hypothetical protein
MNRKEFVQQYVKPRHRAWDDENADQYLRRVWPHLADLFLIADARERACALADAHEQLAFARHTFALCRGDAEPQETADTFLRSLDVPDDESADDDDEVCIGCIRREAWLDGWLFANPDASEEDAEEAFDDFLDAFGDADVQGDDDCA